MQLTLSKCDDYARWNHFVKSSPQGSIFCRTDFLDSLETDYELWWIEDRGEQRMGTIVLLDENGTPRRAPYPFSLYHGVLCDDRSAALPTHSRVNDALQLEYFLLSKFEERYNRISFCMHPRVEDLRAFSWFHYHEPDKGRFHIDLHYTGLIDIKTCPDMETYVASIRRLRKREYRKAQAEGLIIESSQDIDTLARLYWLTLESQGNKFDSAIDRHMRMIARSALSSDYGELLVCKNPAGDAIYATLFLWDEYCAYHLIGNTHPDFRYSGGGTFAMIEIIRQCGARGLLRVDTCGMNSPDRGDYKVSFNAVPVPYFEVTWDRPDDSRR